MTARHGASRHIGLSLGRLGMSGMHTQSLVPFRSTRPSCPITVAAAATDAGAALRACALRAAALGEAGGTVGVFAGAWRAAVRARPPDKPARRMVVESRLARIGFPAWGLKLD